METSQILSRTDFERMYFTSRRELPDPVDDLMYDIVQGREVKKVLQRSTNIGPQGANWLALSLHFLPGIQRIELPFGNIGDEGVKSLSEVLPMLLELQFLGLGSNSITPLGVFYLTSAIPDLKKLTGIDLSGNLIQEEGIGMLTGAISTQVQKLIFRKCEIDICASESLPELLKTCPNLLSLDLGFNRCQNVNKFSPSRLFSHISRLEELILTGCPLDSIALHRLISILPGLPFIQDLGLGYMEHDEITVEMFADILPSLRFFRGLSLGNLGEKEIYRRFGLKNGICVPVK